MQQLRKGQHKAIRMPAIATLMISGGMQAGLDEVDISDQHAKKGCNRFQVGGFGGLGWLVDDRRTNKMPFRRWGVGKPIYKKCTDWTMGV